MTMRKRRIVSKHVTGRLAYIACPFTKLDPKEKVDCVDGLAEAVSVLFGLDHFAVSPILHNWLPWRRHELPTAFEDWESYNLLLLSKCDDLIVFTYPGWRDSKGVHIERRRAIFDKKPVFHLHHKTFRLTHE